jgi:hypothetical protein
VSIVTTISPVTDAVLAALRTIGSPFGDAQRPAGPTPAPKSFFPYGIVRTSLVRSEGSFTDPSETGLYRVEVTCVGLDREGVEWFADRSREVLLDVSMAGIDVVWSEDAGGQSARLDPDPVLVPGEATSARRLMFAVVVVNLMVTTVPSGS